MESSVSGGLLWIFKIRGFSRRLLFVKLNKNSNIQYQFKFKMVVSCPEIAGYGPLRKLISVNFDIWITTLVLAFIVLILILISKITIIKNTNISHSYFLYFYKPTCQSYFSSHEP